VIWTGPTSDLYEGVREHERLAALLAPADRELLRRAADVLEPGAVVLGMATREREGVVPDWHYARGARLVRAPAGPGAASSAYAGAPPTRPSPTVGVLR
jgi:hypothetical protein